MVYAYSDYDVDGVDDSIDLCPNTPFTLTVDEKGCEEGRVYRGTLTFLTGIISSTDNDTDDTSNLLFALNYRYNEWELSLSTLNDITNTASDTSGTFYISSGYYVQFSDRLQLKFSLGTKQWSQQDEYYVTGSMDYRINEMQNLFLLYNYSTADGSSAQKYNQSHAFSLGSGRALSGYWYSALSYDFSQTDSVESEVYRALSWSNTVAFSSGCFILANYSYGLSQGAFDHTFSLQFGIHFE